MASFLAYAEAADTTDSSLTVVVLCVTLFIIVCALAFIPLRMARVRRHRQAEVIVAVAVLWALVTAGSLTYTSMARMQWSREYNLRIQTGYFDPRDKTGAPAYPWALWGAFAAVYAGLVVWAASQKNAPRPRPPGV